MTGKLNEHPLAELVREVVSEKLSGSLRLEQERVKTVVYFDRGELIYATSNLRPHRLAAALHRWRIITDAQFASLSQENKTDAETGIGLVERGVLTEEALRELRARQVADVLRPALLWTSGAWTFDPRVRLLEDVRVSIELPELLMEAARRFPRNLAAGRFPNTNERVQPQPEAANYLSLLPSEGFILSRIDAPLRLHELLAISGLPRDETLHACYVLALGGLLVRENWSRAFTPEEVAKALAIGEAAAQSAPAATPRATQAKRTEAEQVNAEPVVDERRELEELFERVGRAANHYQVLGVIRSADQETLKRTYHTLARRFHPDRFHQDATLHSRVEDVFARIAQAYETLKDRSSRAVYDLKLEKEKEVNVPRPSPRAEAPAQNVNTVRDMPPPQPPSSGASGGEESFQRGMTAIQMGNTVMALSSFAEAARLAPQVARYRAHYGQALAQNAQMHHRAETEIQAAVTLEPTNIIYRIMLAKLYRQLGFNKRAQGEIERALMLDAQNEEAQHLLAELRSVQGAR